MKLSDDTYYEQEANQAFFSVSQYKDFCKCEAMALAKIHGEYEQPTTKAMLIGILCDRWFEGNSWTSCARNLRTSFTAATVRYVQSFVRQMTLSSAYRRMKDSCSICPGRNKNPHV